MRSIPPFVFLFSNGGAPEFISNRLELKKHFDNYRTSGSIVMHDLNNKSIVEYNANRCEKQFTPASTFKIVNVWRDLKPQTK
jgi:beta-lactamase class D